MTALLQDSFSVFILHKEKFIQNRKLTNFSVGILDNLTYFRIQYCFRILHQRTTEGESLVFLQDSFETCFGIEKFVRFLFWASYVSLYLAMKYSKYGCLFFIIILKNFFYSLRTMNTFFVVWSLVHWEDHNVLKNSCN